MTKMAPEDRKVLNDLVAGVAALQVQLPPIARQLEIANQEIGSVRDELIALRVKAQVDEQQNRRWLDPAVGVGYGVVGAGIAGATRWLLELWQGFHVKH